MKTAPPSSKRKSGALNQVSLMHVFRESAAKKDAKTGDATYKDGDRELSSRALQRRHGADQSTLRAHLNEDLSNLMNTIRLDAAVDMQAHKYVRKSVLNFGMDDMANLHFNNDNKGRLVESLRNALINHEPRLIPETIEVTLREADHETRQCISFDIQAELASNPVDVPLEFVAEIDVGAGKLNMSGLKVMR